MMSAIANLRVAFTVLAFSTIAAMAPAMASDASIEIANFTFSPATLTVKPGTTVTWTNGDDIPHSIVEDSRVFHSPPLDTGEKFSMTFTSSGTVNYFCGFHAHMPGRIVVEP